MMGSGPTKDKKFIQKIMAQLKAGTEELFIVDDKDGTPTYTQDFAKNVKLLLESEKWGLYNMVCGGQTSRFEVASELIDILGLSNTVKITAVSSSYFKDEYSAPRPACERLINSKLNRINMNIMRDWKVALKEYLQTYYHNYLTENINQKIMK